ncbi:MAG TPA: glucose-6-phosphate isomerase [Firmicutes bacterium]|nr:glucose-6-phosphate isomerase [Bacillota bacterium]
MSVKFNYKYAADVISEEEFESLQPFVNAAHEMLHNGTGAGSDFTGWLTWPDNYDREEYERIKKSAEKIRNDSQVLVVIGIGGSYLGARAVIEYIHSPSYNLMCKDTPQIFFAGNSLSGSEMANVLKLCDGKDVSVCVISKSGTTTEPAIAFRIFKEYMENRYGKMEAAKRIYCVTDKSRGTLKTIAEREGYESFVIPDEIGGRYSVLTAVGLLPIAVSGADIDALMAGARDAAKAYQNSDISKNDCYRYAAARSIMYRKNKAVELLVSFEPRFALMAEWFKQLFGESEGKDNKGIFPASCIYSTDLHSMGQFVQEGSRIMFETFVNIEGTGKEITIKKNEDNGDGLNFLDGESMGYINGKAMQGTLLAHADGGVPSFVLDVPGADEHSLGWLIYFFEKACAICSYLLGVNPFNQPGVEAYKRNMFALLGKPGYETEREVLEKRLNG